MWAGPAQAATPDDEAAKAKDNITTIGNVRIGAEANSVAVQAGYAYLTGLRVEGEPAEFLIINVQNPETPYETARIHTDANKMFDVAVAGTVAYVTFGNYLHHDSGLDLFDISDPWHPNLLSSLALDSVDEVIAGDHLAYVSTDATTDVPGGLRIINTQDPLHPYVQAQVDVDDDVFDMKLSGDYIYLVGLTTGLHLINVAQPGAPYEEGVFLNDVMVTHVAVKGSVAYATASDHPDNFLIIVDVGTPSAPVEVSRTTLDIIPDDIAASGDHVYLADRYQGLTALDVSDPEAPVVDGFIYGGDEAYEVMTAGSLIYGADGWRGMYIFRDVNEAPLLNLMMYPIDPPVVLTPDNGMFGYNLRVENRSNTTITVDIAYEAIYPDHTRHAVLRENDLVIPAHSALEQRGRTQSVPDEAPPGDYTYVATVISHSGGAMSAEFPFQKAAPSLAKNAGPKDFALGSAFPNPFNPRTAIDFVLPTATVVDLRVFDLKGRRIRTLIQGQEMQAGTHDAVWDGRDDAGQAVAGGVYLLHLKTRDSSATRRITLVK